MSETNKQTSSAEGNDGLAAPSAESAAKQTGYPFSGDTFQSVPSILLNELTQKNGKGKAVLQVRDIAIYALLKAHAWQKDNCFPSYQRLAKEAGCNASTIQRSLKRLEAAGHVQLKNRSCAGKIYILTDVEGCKIVRRERRHVASMLHAPMPVRPSCQQKPAIKEIPLSALPPKAANIDAPVNMFTDDMQAASKERPLSEDEFAEMEAARQKAGIEIETDVCFEELKSFIGDAPEQEEDDIF